MDVAAFLERIRRREDYAGQIEYVEVLAERDGQFAEPARPLPPALAELLAARGIERLYSHQVAALELARSQRDLVVVTGTASGKTLATTCRFWKPCSTIPQARALYLFPTKALAQDQHKGLLELVGGSPAAGERIRAGVYDGDTPTAQRRRIQAESQLVLSNPDMLHASILPYHPKWNRFFGNLRYVVVDEIHTYRGILGANVACVLRRLERDLRALWFAARVPGRQCHDCQPRRVGRQTVGPRRGRSRWRRRPAGTQILRAVEPQPLG